MRWAKGIRDQGSVVSNQWLVVSYLHLSLCVDLWFQSVCCAQGASSTSKVKRGQQKSSIVSARRGRRKRKVDRALEVSLFAPQDEHSTASCTLCRVPRAVLRYPYHDPADREAPDRREFSGDHGREYESVIPAHRLTWQACCVTSLKSGSLPEPLPECRP